jgi:hypothetical protein
MWKMIRLIILGLVLTIARTLTYGMRIPSAGQVAWMLPAGPKPYWRGQITSIRYSFAE